ncbi:MAG: 7-cyano-7-deazaguanine synthase QueC [Candidatus Cloacimonadaceae bacterium]|nr:7-cyano-7-deazaguanine synthase QueC [Candidatus Cloacimonadaceae bacterium]MDP3113643.1 7-cyano-7-deazaguanine synthase QueC [Candidatus Cloacimonadaceae bacterium]
MKSAIVLLSGGMDSLVTAAIAVSSCAEVNFLHVSYGQRTESKERECFELLCNHYHPKRAQVFDMHWLGEIGGSALTDQSIALELSGKGNGIPVSYVPFRNANLICAAVSWAEVIGADSIWLGAVEEDSSGYPDCREVFLDAMQRTIELGTTTEILIRIITPILHKSKAEIVKLGIELSAPFVYSWSCYQDNETACGICDSCRLRLKAFAAAGSCDPIPYRIWGI